MINITNKRATIFGLPGSGKSKLLESIMRSTPDHVLYDPMNEHHTLNRYLPTDRNSVTELSTFIKHFVMRKRPKLFGIDEANKYIKPKPHPLPPGVDDLNDLSRHWDIAWISVARRPSQFHSDIVELCHYVFLFRLNGRLDYRVMEDMARGLGDEVRALPQYHFVVLENGATYSTHAPIELPRLTNK